MRQTTLLLVLFGLIVSVVAQTVILRNPGCNAFDANGVCTACATRFIKDRNNICQPVNPNCKTYNELTGACLSCYTGFSIVEDTCLPGVADVQLDPNCNKFQNSVCVKCSYGYFFDLNGQCARADPSCQTFNELNGACTSCYVGFVVSGGKCIREAPRLTDVNCNQFDANGFCIKCSSGFYFKQGVCTKIEDSCKNFDLNLLQCTACYSGYTLNQWAQCIKDEAKVNPNPYCAEWKDSLCLRCAQGSIFDKNGICALLDTNCKEFQPQTAICRACYDGYTLQFGSCVKAAVQAVSDPNCNSFVNGVCTKCSNGFYFKQGVCTKIEDTCKNFDVNFGQCTACYSGYVLNQWYQCVKEEAKAITNQYCAEWKDTLCLRCAQGSIFDQKGICVLLDTNCKEFQPQSAICRACYDGYGLQNGGCVKVLVQAASDPSCNTYVNGVCTKCSVGYYFNQKGQCLKIDDNCKTFDYVALRCVDCYAGYQLNIFGECIKFVEQVSDANCAQWNGKVCKKCSVGSEFNQFGVCTLLDAQCKNYDIVNKICRACYTGYEFNAVGVCVKAAVKAVSDPLCAEWLNDVCLRCAFSSYMNPTTKLCTLIDTSCKSSNPQTGACLTCYDGYQLNIYGTCVKVIEELSDANCAEWKGKTCLRCSFGAAFNYFGKCEILDAQCKQYDLISGLCSGCYTGYQLNTLHTCVQEAPKAVTDPLCAEWKNDICTKCAFASYFGPAGKCIQSDATCKFVNSVTGLCLSCYDGYEVKNGACVKINVQNLDLYCAEWNGNLCTKCSIGSRFNSQGKCTLLDPQCRTYDDLKAECSACYTGYELNAFKVCVKSAVQDVSWRDQLCAEWNGNSCVKCAQGTYFNSQRICTQIDALCSSFNKLTGECLSCYSGYDLSLDKKCVKSAQVSSTNPLCAEWDNINKICTKCSVGSFFNSFGLCEKVDALCKTFNALNGACTSCFDGYAIFGSKCVISKEAPRDPLCKTFNGAVCTECSFGAFFNRNGICQLSDASCLSFNPSNGLCLSCYSGYVVVNGKCEVDKSNLLTDPYCAEFKNSLCVRCSDGYYFEKDGKCTVVDPLCATYNPLNGKCLSCFAGFQLYNGLCIVAVETSKDPNCAAFDKEICLYCSKGFIFNDKGACVLTNPLCKTYDPVTGACLTCYNGYVVSQYTCVIDKSSQSSNCAEYVDNVCVRCASRTFLNSSKQCQRVSEDCRTYSDLNGACLSCYSGYGLRFGACYKSEVQGGCAQFDQAGRCTKCANSYYINNGACSIIDAQCARFNLATAQCEGCYQGYTLLEGRCEIAKVTQEYEVKNCIAYNTDNKCIQCYDRFYLSNNQCKDVSIFCKTYDLITGYCTSCYTGFSLLAGQCKK